MISGVGVRFGSGAYELGPALLSAGMELATGFVIALAFQLAFAAIYLAGRTVDVQAGFGLAMLIDPTTQAQVPLVGSVFAYAAGAVFFATGGQYELLRICVASLQIAPLAGPHGLPNLATMTTLISAVFATAFGVAGGMILSLFLADLAIAMLSRTIPQMNVLVFGFEVKTILLLLVLPATLGVSGVYLAKLVVLVFDAIPRFL